jgi:hypothetical protein
MLTGCELVGEGKILVPSVYCGSLRKCREEAYTCAIFLLIELNIFTQSQGRI